jgi:hypothetical protein
MLLASYVDPPHGPEGDSQNSQSFMFMSSDDSSQGDANALVMAALAAQDEADDDELNDDEVEGMLLEMLPSSRGLLSSSLFD